MTTVPVSEVKSTHDRSSRTAAHSHIKGLGLSSDGRATPSAGGFVGQAAAREVCGALILFRVPILTGAGMRSGRRPRQGEEDVGQSCAARRWPWNRQDGIGIGRQPGTRHKGPLLPDCRQRDILGRGQEDGGAHGELQKGHWYALASAFLAPANHAAQACASRKQRKCTKAK